MDLVGLLIAFLIFAVVIYVAYLVLGMIELPEPIKKIVYLVVGLIFLLVFLDRLGLYRWTTWR